MVALRDCLGEDRWTKVQQSSLHGFIRNVRVADVTVEEIVSLSLLFDCTVQALVDELYAAFILEEGE